LPFLNWGKDYQIQESMETQFYDDNILVINRIKQLDFNSILIMNVNEKKYYHKSICGNLKNLKQSCSVMIGSCFVALGLDDYGMQ
jgi:hypothetical protein